MAHFDANSKKCWNIHSGDEHLDIDVKIAHLLARMFLFYLDHKSARRYSELKVCAKSRWGAIERPAVDQSGLC